ncbi:hypothetical protein OsI_26362 [Oryza sativa Indica Group]|uniref:Uncharacterized protein n=1 Tax=Oryza sativa subsp. indica TaxID=39946 RepID=A2YMA6_ORYSI|nr:hypothetical protein OsI_26362 [Oryza sativa Indica Group]
MLRRSLVAHAVLLFAAVALPLAAAQPWPVCGTSGGNYTAGSTYETNLLRLALTLRANASSSLTLFASGALGSAPDTVYGLLQCRGDMNPSDCFDCGTNVWRDAGPTCNRTKDAILVYNQCYAQFSDRGDFLAATNNSGAYSLLISGTNITSTNVTGYDGAVTSAKRTTLCGTGGTYTAGSTYESNLLNLTRTLRENASSSPTLFAAGALGSAPNPVYGLLLCRGDVSPSDCAYCGLNVVQDVGRSVCNRSKDSVLVYDQCYARFSNKADFLVSSNNSGEVSLLLTNGTSITSAGVAGYNHAVSELLNATVRYAVENSTRLFATGQRVGNENDTGFRNIYSMAQCSPDLSPALCRRCLDDLVGKWWKTFPPKGEGAKVAGAKCYLRSELGQGPFYNGAPMVMLRADVLTKATDVVPATSGKSNSATKVLVIVVLIMAGAIIAAISLCMWNMRNKRSVGKAEVFSGPDTGEQFESVKSSLLSLASLRVATNNFDESMKLGEGGFGPVYKGLLLGQEVAVKRLAKGSNQGLGELKNELVLVAKLHHNNLVRLIGFCLEEGEMLLVYEYMPNKSLDTFLFDTEQSRRLDWKTRLRIIEGIAQGLQYLHQDSEKRIIHRDMKASNVLLDADLSPKIGDFGLARLVKQDKSRDITKRVAGTFGYMSPEYVMRGEYSTKSDVFSFGILVIEIVTGKKRSNGTYFTEQYEDIISTVKRHWVEGNIVDMIDQSLGKNYPEAEVLKCIKIGLLCVQQNPIVRPTMTDVIVLLNGGVTRSLPASAAHRPTSLGDGSSGYSQTITQLSAR